MLYINEEWDDYFGVPTIASRNITGIQRIYETIKIAAPEIDNRKISCFIADAAFTNRICDYFDLSKDVEASCIHKKRSNTDYNIYIYAHRCKPWKWEGQTAFVHECGHIIEFLGYEMEQKWLDRSYRIFGDNPVEQFAWAFECKIWVENIFGWRTKGESVPVGKAKNWNKDGLMNKDFEGKPINEVGEIPGAKVKAATDAAGSQVIVKGDDIHLLSRPLKNHQAAVVLAERIVAAKTTQIYHEWFDLKKGGPSLNLFALFGGPLRGSDPPAAVLDAVAEKVLGKKP